MQTHSKLMQLVRALARSRSGHSAIEFAFIAPAMLMFILGIAEVGRVLWLQNALDYAVVGTARCMSNSLSGCAASVSRRSPKQDLPLAFAVLTTDRKAA